MSVVDILISLLHSSLVPHCGEKVICTVTLLNVVYKLAESNEESSP